MRTKVTWAVVLVFSVFVVGAAAQPRVIPESEFSTVVSKGYDMLSTLPYRAQISDKTPIYGQQVSTEVLVLEVVEHQPPRRYRNVKIWKSENGRRREEFV